MLGFLIRTRNTVRTVTDETGQDLVEYSLLAALIATACVVSMQGVAIGLINMFAKVTAAFP